METELPENSDYDYELCLDVIYKALNSQLMFKNILLTFDHRVNLIFWLNLLCERNLLSI